MTRAVRRCLAPIIGAVLALASGAAMATASATPPPIPEIHVVDAPFADDVVIPPGSTFKLEGAGWPANTLVQLEVCGSEARSGSSDCSLETAQIVASDGFGAFRARVAVVVPPTACPCVVRAVSQANGVVAIADVDIPGAPIQTIDDGDVVKPAIRRLEVQSASLQGSDSWGAWVGGHPQRGLEFTVVNAGDVAIADSTVSLTVGPSEDPTGFVRPVSLGRLEVGEKKTYRIPVEFDAISFGTLVVKGSITGTTERTTFTATTTSYPWILIAIPILLVLQLILLVARNIARRRLHRDEPPVAAENPTDPDRPIADAALAAIPIEQTDEASEDASTDAMADEPEFDSVNPLSVAVIANGDGRGYADDCIISVLEFVSESLDAPHADRRLIVVRGLEATKHALLDTMQLAAATTHTGSLAIAKLHDDRDSHGAGIIDVVSILGVDQATVRQAHEASVDLGHWIEREIGLTLFVTNGTSAGAQLFRCDGMPTSIDADDIDGGAGLGSVGGGTYSRIFFSDRTSQVDLHGLIPLVVYARTNPTAKSTPRDATDVEGSEGRRILSIGDFLDELLARGDDTNHGARGRDERDGHGSARGEVGAPRNVVLAASTVGVLHTKNGDPLGGSPSVSSEPPENTV